MLSRYPIETALLAILAGIILAVSTLAVIHGCAARLPPEPSCVEVNLAGSPLVRDAGGKQ